MVREGLVLYDGYCNLCSRTVQWIIRNDPGKRFTFTPLPEQPPEGANASYGDTVLLELGGKVYDRSAAVLRIAVRLRFPWPLLGLFFVIPRFIRDPFYRVVARNRKRWFGKRSTCYVP